MGEKPRATCKSTLEKKEGDSPRSEDWEEDEMASKGELCLG